MSVGQNTVELWRRAPAWRVLVISAVVATGLAVMSARQGGGGGGGSVASGGGGAGGAGSNAATPGLTGGVPSGQASLQCGPPQNQTTLQAPIVLSNSGQMPANVTTGTGAAVSAPSSGGGLSSSVTARFTQFVTRVDAADQEQRLGERCVRMQGALEVLEPADYAYADCFQDADKKLVAAQSCAGDFSDSESRFDRLVTAHAASRSDGSAERIEELARARSGMKPFDESREAWTRNDAAVTAGNAAIQTLDASNQRLDELRAAASQSPVDLGRLAAAAALTAFDRARLTAQGRAQLEQAEAAQSQLSQSDRRLDAVAEALQGNPAADPQGRTRLIGALSALLPLDSDRATGVQRAMIEEARQTAAQFAASDLIAAVGGVDLATADPAKVQQIHDLAVAARRYGAAGSAPSQGAAPTDSSPEPQPEPQPGATDTATQAPPPAAGGAFGAALAVADRAGALLAQSDRRIEDVLDMVQRFDAGGPSALGAEVLRVFDAITPFDRDRMSDPQQAALERLAELRDITVASQAQTLSRSVPIFVTAGAEDELSQLALTELRRNLENDGFTLVDALERAAVEMRMSRSEVEEKSVKIGSTRIVTAETALTITARWTVSDDALSVPRVEGSAAGSEFTSLTREAVTKAAERAAAAIAELTGS